MYEMRLPDVLSLAWKVKGLVVSSSDDLTYMKKRLRRSRIACA